MSNKSDYQSRPHLYLLHHGTIYLPIHSQYVWIWIFQPTKKWLWIYRYNSMCSLCIGDSLNNMKFKTTCCVIGSLDVTMCHRCWFKISIGNCNSADSRRPVWFLPSGTWRHVSFYNVTSVSEELGASIVTRAAGSSETSTYFCQNTIYQIPEDRNLSIKDV
jgi:hypothetical protein